MYGSLTGFRDFSGVPVFIFLNSQYYENIPIVFFFFAFVSGIIAYQRFEANNFECIVFNECSMDFITNMCINV